jgi:hypothetical protein
MDFAHGYLLILAALAVYIAAISLITTQVSYPLYASVPATAFVGYHRRYNRRITPVIVAPGFPTFLACAAFVFLRPDRVPLWLATLPTAGGVVALLATVTAAIPSHLALQRHGFAPAPYRRLRTADAIRTTACLTSAAALSAAVLLAFTPR